MDDSFLRRFGVIELTVARTREDVSAIRAALAYLAAKSDPYPLKSDISELKSYLPHLATKADVLGMEVDAYVPLHDMPSMGTRIYPLVCRQRHCRRVSAIRDRETYEVSSEH